MHTFFFSLPLSGENHLCPLFRGSFFGLTAMKCSLKRQFSLISGTTMALYVCIEALLSAGQRERGGGGL